MTPLKVVYLELAAKDVVWMRYCYDVIFPEGRSKGLTHCQKSVALLTTHPQMGRALEKKPRRCFTVPRTPFTIIYQERGERLEIVRILDQRSGTYLAALLGKP